MPQTETERRILSPEAMTQLEKLVQTEPTLENAFRLMNDADFLFAGGRYPSVVALAVLCMEEIGKYLLTTWSKTPAFSFDKRRLHQSKQMAIAALFIAGGMRQELKKRNVDFSDLGSPEKMARLVEAIQVGYERESSLAGSVESGVMQIVKHSGIYYDEEYVAKGIEPSNISATSADEMMRMCSRAFMVLTETKSIALGGDLYPLLTQKGGFATPPDKGSVDGGSGGK
jgi:AbiV family abortive infection protein